MHCETNNVISNEQKGCKKNTQGCKDQLTIDSVVVQQSIRKYKNLSIAYIDYCKAFDSMPHDYLIHILSIYKVDTNIINLMKHLMTKWKICLCTSNGISNPISIRNGIFQGDAFSPLWFCLGLNPLSKQLCKMKAELGFKINYTEGHTSLNHLMYVDDIKLYAPNKEKLHRMIQIVDEFSASIKMSFGLDKCKIAHLMKGKVVNDNEGCVISSERIIENLGEEESYKYLGFLQLRGFKTNEIKTHIENIFNKRLKKILKSKLNAGNKCKAINTWAIPVYNYSFGVIKWSDTDINNMSRNIRVLLTKHQSHHPRSAVERVILPRELGGVGILNIAELQEKQICNLRDYFINSNNCETISAIVKSDINYTPLNLSNLQHDTPSNVKTKEQLLDTWKNKEIHGKHPNGMFKDEIDTYTSNLWLKRGRLFMETEGFAMAIQDRVIAIRNYRKHILHEDISTDKCRRCNTTSESIEHIISGCPILSSKEYLDRHNNVA